MKSFKTPSELLELIKDGPKSYVKFLYCHDLHGYIRRAYAFVQLDEINTLVAQCQLHPKELESKLDTKSKKNFKKQYARDILTNRIRLRLQAIISYGSTQPLIDADVVIESVALTNIYKHARSCEQRITKLKEALKVLKQHSHVGPYLEFKDHIDWAMFYDRPESLKSFGK